MEISLFRRNDWIVLLQYRSLFVMMITNSTKNNQKIGIISKREGSRVATSTNKTDKTVPMLNVQCFVSTAQHQFNIVLFFSHSVCFYCSLSGIGDPVPVCITSSFIIFDGYNCNALVSLVNLTYPISIRNTMCGFSYNLNWTVVIRNIDYNYEGDGRQKEHCIKSNFRIC